VLCHAAGETARVLGVDTFRVYPRSQAAVDPAQVMVGDFSQIQTRVFIECSVLYNQPAGFYLNLFILVHIFWDQWYVRVLLDASYLPASLSARQIKTPTLGLGF